MSKLVDQLQPLLYNGSQYAGGYNDAAVKAKMLLETADEKIATLEKQLMEYRGARRDPEDIEQIEAAHKVLDRYGVAATYEGRGLGLANRIVALANGRDKQQNLQRNRIASLEKQIKELETKSAEEREINNRLSVELDTLRKAPALALGGLTFDQFRAANKARCLKWHPKGINSWSASDWMTAIVGELGEAASLIKMRNRERDGLPGNKFSPTQKQIADEIADIFTYLDLFAESLGINLGAASVEKFNEVSERVGLPDRILLQATGGVRLEQPSAAFEFIDILFGDQPGVNGGKFVEVENAFKQSIKIGEWLKRSDGYWALRLPTIAHAIVIESVKAAEPSVKATTLEGRMALQNAEFDACSELAKAYNRITLTPIVDDDYPEVRCHYESAVRLYINALRNNGKL